MVGVWLSVLDHDPIPLRRTAPEILTLYQRLVDDPLGVFRSRKVQVEIAAHSFDPPDALGYANGYLDGFGDLLSPLLDGRAAPAPTPAAPAAA
jgi:hypothetical protein